jgi:hypothetical protein
LAAGGNPIPLIIGVAVTGPTTMEPRVPAALPQHEQQLTSHSDWTTRVNSVPLDNMLRVVTEVQQIMGKFNGAVSDKVKILAITKIA